MMHLHAGSIETAPKLTSVIDLEFIRADRNSLTIAVLAEAVDLNELNISVKFSEVIGFRCLDETDLVEFWPSCGLPNGWLYEVFSGGWRALESSREGFTSKRVAFHREFFLVTRDRCISVIAKCAPILTISSSGSPTAPAEQ
jgi:hypothetical protein